MIDGTYEVTAHTPLGKKQGTLVLARKDATCKATLKVAGKTAHLVGSVEGEQVTFDGKVHLPFPIGNLAYQLAGTVEGDEIKATCKTKKFSFKVEGTRIA